MYDTISSIKDYYKQVYNLAKKYEINEHESGTGWSLYNEITLTGKPTDFNLYLDFNNRSGLKSELEFELDIIFNNDGISISVNIWSDAEGFDDDKIYDKQNLSINDFKNELSLICSHNIYEFIDGSDKRNICELIEAIRHI